MSLPRQNLLTWIKWTQP